MMRPGGKLPVRLSFFTITVRIDMKDQQKTKALLHKQLRLNTKNRKNMVKKQTRDNKERVRGKE